MWSGPSLSEMASWVRSSSFRIGARSRPASWSSHSAWLAETVIGGRSVPETGGVALVAEEPHDAAHLPTNGMRHGRPHPCFPVQKDAAEAARKGLGIEAACEVSAPRDLRQQNEAIEGLKGRGHDAVPVLSGDAPGHRRDAGRAGGARHPLGRARGPHRGAQARALRPAHRRPRVRPTSAPTSRSRRWGGGDAAHFAGLLVDPDNRLCIDAAHKAAHEAEGVGP